MKAYQYYWHNGRIVGRTPAGTMGFDNKKGHHHWHFEQFAKYVLLNASKKVAVRSEKVGFCIAPTDSVNMAMPGATWQPIVNRPGRRVRRPDRAVGAGVHADRLG